MIHDLSDELRWSPTPGIPIIDTAVKYLQNGRFGQPKCAERLVVYADPAVLDTQGPIPERMFKRISPEEEHHSMILATARDLRRDCNVREWAMAWLTQPVTFRCIRKLSSLSGTVSDDLQAALFFEASQLREKIGEDFESMYLTTVFWLKQSLQHAPVRNALLLGDELFGKANPLSNSLYKLEALMQACGSDHVRFEAMLVFIFDMVLNNDLQSWELSWGPLTGKKQPQNKGSLCFQIHCMFFFRKENEPDFLNISEHQ
eukprot:s737_g19.t1